MPPKYDASKGYKPAETALLQPSRGQAKTFYVFRVQSDEDYAPENQNVANLAGALWYLHHEIVNNRYQRRFKKTRVQRFKMTTKAPQPLLDAGMNFGVRYAYDMGECTGPYDCQKAYDLFGYFVGCNNVGSFPTNQWADQVSYDNALWFSMPGKCSSRKYYAQSTECRLMEPGGACANATGAGDCSYSYEAAGEISINELEGIESFEGFVAGGGWEYNNQTDQGVHMTFWDGIENATACKARVDHAMQLFDTKYPEMATTSSLPAPACDFDVEKFYAVAPRDEPQQGGDGTGRHLSEAAVAIRNFI